MAKKSHTSLFILIFFIIAFAIVILFPDSTVGPLLDKLTMWGHPIASRVVCGAHLSSLGKQITVYAGEHHGLYPTADKWCDLLITDADASNKVFICPSSDALEDESSYAFNKNLSNKKVTDEPNDVVVLFETNYGKTNGKRNVPAGTREWYRLMKIELHNKHLVYKDRWNQVGGPEILTIDNHSGEGATILFNDGHTEFVEKKDFDKLNWGTPQEPNKIQNVK